MGRETGCSVHEGDAVGAAVWILEGYSADFGNSGRGSAEIC